MGTAGHVDHGKTTLIKALTDVDCDTHKEEKQRGITINLGFSHLELPNGDSLGIVDVPGHRDFVHNMVGGASGIDFVLMVIAANSGIMPQTIEHLNIMRILGIRHGLIALTKVDLVEESELLELIRAEVFEFTQGTFLEDAPVVEISSTTGQGMDELISAITVISSRTTPKPSKGLFRMFVDRIFSVSGFGTVVTGSAGSGTLKIGDTAYLCPGSDKELRVRHLQRHGEDVNSVAAGDRAAINLVGLEKSDFVRGMVISDQPLDGKLMVDATLELFDPDARLGIWSQVIFHCGTYESQVRIHLMDKDTLICDESALVQIHLTTPCVLRPGDRFVIRNSSSEITLGGGSVIDASPLHHRRRPEKLLKSMEALAQGDLRELIATVIRKQQMAIYSTQIASNLNLSQSEVEAILAGKLPSDIIKIKGKSALILTTKNQQEELRKGILNSIRDFRARNPLVPKGPAFDEIRSSLTITPNSAAEESLRIVLAKQTQSGKLQEVEKTWITANDQTHVNQDMKQNIDAIESYMLQCGMQTPLMSEMKSICQKRKVGDKELRQILFHLTTTDKAYKIDDEYIHATVVDSCRTKLLNALKESPKGLTVADFRDISGGNRKICLLLLSQYDAEQSTKRVGDIRVPGNKADQFDTQQGTQQ